MASVESTSNPVKASPRTPPGKPGDSRPPRTLPGGRDPRDTPAMRQFAQFKKSHPECVLFFRMGDFYEMFDDDAVLCHKVLGITLTERTKGVPMAGVPYHAVEGYLRKMIREGYRVAVCEQVEDPATAKGVVRRAVTRVLTPGTLVDEALLDESRANQIAAIQFTEAGDAPPAVLAIAELSTGAFTLTDLPADRILDELARLDPAELLYVETANGEVPPRVARLRDSLGMVLTARPAWTYRAQEATELIREHFGVRLLDGFGLNEDDPALGPAGALLRYLLDTQTPHDESTPDGAAALLHLRPPHRAAPDDHVVIDASSLRSLEIERTMRTGEAAGSLLASLQCCRSPMGKRLLREWLCFPLRDLARIERRQRAVAALIEDRAFADLLWAEIGGIQDVARISGRISMRRASPRDLVALGRSAGRLNGLIELLDCRPAFETTTTRLRTLAESIGPVAEAIALRCVESPPHHLREGGLFRDGVDQQLDEARHLQRDATDWLAAYQERLIRETAIPRLKIGYNKVFGYYIEITHTHREKVPAEFSRKQTLKNAERYITPALKEFEDKVTTAESRAVERERVLFDRLVKEAAAQVEALVEFGEHVARLDVLSCLADNAARRNYVRPELVDEPVLDIRQGRHPVLDVLLAEGFVPNDCRLGRVALLAPGSPDDSDQSRPDQTRPDESGLPVETETDTASTTLALITGPNMAGKSTYIRQVALITLLAHVGSHVPAESATIGVVDRIFTRIGANDELHAGQSTFMVEMTETANILHHATDRSLVILDEIGRGTGTLDGLSLAWAITETLARVQCRTLFATHYHEITSLADRIPAVRNLHVAVREWGEAIIFLYRILPGRSDRSYGVHVAKLAGLPTETVDRAGQLLDTLAVQTDRAHLPNSSDPPPGEQQLSLFTEYVEHPLLEEIRGIDLNVMTPIEAFEMLREMRDRLNR